MISDLKRDNPFITGRRIRHDIGKVTIQRHQDGIQILGLRDDNGIIRIPRDMFLQDENLMTCLTKSLDD